MIEFFRKKRHRFLSFAFVLVALPTIVIGQAFADERPLFAPAIEVALEQVIIPNHLAFSDAASAMVPAVSALCDAPSEAALRSAQRGFEDAVIAWSRVEMFRFGPAREDNRFEKLFYWPDRKGRGLKQVQAILAEENEAASTAATLQSKSVAVQGLPSLEFVLFGTGSAALVTGDPFRCRYAQALAEVIAANAEALHEGWFGPDSYANLMRRAGNDGSPYLSHGEAVQDLLRASSEQLQIVRDLKIGSALGETPAKAKPKRAPFWRSNLTVRSSIANLEGVEALFDVAMSDLLSEEDSRYADNFAFELKQAMRILKEAQGEWIEVASTADGHAALSATKFPLSGAVRLASDVYPASLGLTLGFNSLDGD